MVGVDGPCIPEPPASNVAKEAGDKSAFVEVPDEIPIRLVAGVTDPALRAADGAELHVPSRMGRKALRNLVHHLLDCPPAAPDFHFLSSNGASLKTTLAKFITRHELSTELTLSLTYYIPLPPPQRHDPVDASNDWLAAVSAFASGDPSADLLLVAASYSGCPIVSTPETVLLGEDEVREGAHKAPIKGVAWLPGGEAFVTAGHDGMVNLWSFSRDRETGNASSVVCGIFRSEDVAGVCPFESVAVADLSGRNVVALGGSNGSVWILDDVPSIPRMEGEGDSSKRKRADTVDLVARHVGVTSPDLNVSALKWRGEGTDTALLSAGLDGMVRIWDTNTSSVSLSVPGGGKSLSGLAVSASSLLVSAADGAVRVLDGRERRGVVGVTGKGKGHVGMATDVTWMTQGESFASSGLDGSVRAWDMRSYDTPVHIVADVHGVGARTLGLASASQEGGTNVFSAGQDGKIRAVSFSSVT